MAKIILKKETFTIEDGNYEGIITDIITCSTGKIMLKIELSDDSNIVFMKSYTPEQLGKYPIAALFISIDSDDTDDLKDMKVSFEVKNEKSKKTGNNFCNIKKIKNIG